MLQRTNLPFDHLCKFCNYFEYDSLIPAAWFVQVGAMFCLSLNKLLDSVIVMKKTCTPSCMIQLKPG